MGFNKIPAQLSARIAYLDETIPTLQKQLEALEQERAATIAYLPFAGSLAEGSPEPAHTKAERSSASARQNRPYKDPAPKSLLGRAVLTIRASPHGLTIDELMAMGQRGGLPFVRTSLVSQLRKLTQRPGSPLTKVGDRYVALKH